MPQKEGGLVGRKAALQGRGRRTSPGSRRNECTGHLLRLAMKRTAEGAASTTLSKRDLTAAPQQAHAAACHRMGSDLRF